MLLNPLLYHSNGFFFMNKIFKILLLLISLCLITIMICDIIIQCSAHGKAYSSIYKIPKRRIGVLLGTSKYFRNGTPNLYYKNRIAATASLFFAGKIEYVLISGDNSLIYYNEPMDMKKSLVNKGVPSDKIFLDFAGFRTYDSIIRANKVFGAKKYTIISQNFQNQRGLFIANQLGHNAIAYNAKSIGIGMNFEQYVREKLSRVRVFIDFIFNVKTKFLGKKIKIE